MKKIYIVATLAALTFGVSSCSKENVAPTTTTAKATTVAAAGDKSDVGTNQYPPPPVH